MLTMNTPGVEISIARRVEEMVRDLNPMPVFFTFFIFVFMCFVLTTTGKKD